MLALSCVRPLRAVHRAGSRYPLVERAPLRLATQRISRRFLFDKPSRTPQSSKTNSSSSSGSSLRDWLPSQASRIFQRASPPPPTKRRFQSLARAVRYVRIPFIVISVYQLGYQQGIIDHSSNPANMKKRLLQNVLAGVGVTEEETESLQESAAASSHPLWRLSTSLSSSSSHELQRIATIGRQILIQAQRHVQQEQLQVAQEMQSKLPPDISQEHFQGALETNEEFAFWKAAQQRLDGDWTYVLVKSDLPNAFVTEVLPHHLFITTGMLQLVDNDDELSLVLGHELSHSILGHITEANYMGTALRTVEVLLLSMDPTEGLLSLFFVAGLATLRTAITAAHSRDNEHQADTLGLQLAAQACFDTRKASLVFSKMHAAATASLSSPPSSKRWLTFADTHPPTQERYERLVQASETENALKYRDSTCASVATRMRSMLEQAPNQ